MSCTECHIQIYYRCTFLLSYQLYYFVEKKIRHTCINCTPTGLVDLSSDGVDMLINDIKKFSWDRSKKKIYYRFNTDFLFPQIYSFFPDFLLKTPTYPWTLPKNDTFPLTLVSVIWLIVLNWSRQEFTEKKITKNTTTKIHFCEQKKITKERKFLQENRKRIATYLSINSIVNVLEVLSISLNRFHLKANP